MGTRPARALAIAVVLATGRPSHASDGAPEPDLTERVRKLEEQALYVQDLEQEVRLLKRQLEAKDEAGAAQGPAPAIGAGPDGFFLRSADGKFLLRLRGYTQLDSRWFASGESAGNSDTFVFRRVRPVVEGTLDGWVDFKIMPDFANPVSATSFLQDAYANLRPFGPLAQLQVGKYRAPFGLERLQSPRDTIFIERGLPSNLVPDRDLGAMLWGGVGDGLLDYQLAVMNGVRDGESGDTDANDAKDVLARVFVHPFSDTTLRPLAGLGIGMAASWGRETGTPASYKTAGQQTFFAYAPGVSLDGGRLRLGPQASWYWGPLGMLFEWVRSDSPLRKGSEQLDARTDAWQIAASWVLTGENASYFGVAPRTRFSPRDGTWGAFEVAARYGELDVAGAVFERGLADPSAAARRAREIGLGVNWYLSRWVKLVLDYDHTRFEGGAPGGRDRAAENVIGTRLQLAY